MNAPKVDVLAVMDREINRLACAWHDFAPGDTGPEPPSLQAAREARAVAAELIEKAQHVALWMDACPARDELRAALARVGGAQ